MKFLTVLFILLLIFVAVPAAVLWWSSTHSTLAFEPPPKAIGTATPVVVRIGNPHGVRHVAARIEQNGASHTLLLQDQTPVRRFTFLRMHQPAQGIRFIA